MINCNFCLHEGVCGIKWSIKQDMKQFEQVDLDITCRHYIPAMNEPEIEEVSEEPKAEPKKRTAIKKKVVRRAKK
jgi:hypothetical protein